MGMSVWIFPIYIKPFKMDANDLRLLNNLHLYATVTNERCITGKLCEFMIVININSSANGALLETSHFLSHGWHMSFLKHLLMLLTLFSIFNFRKVALLRLPVKVAIHINIYFCLVWLMLISFKLMRIAWLAPQWKWPFYFVVVFGTVWSRYKSTWILILIKFNKVYLQTTTRKISLWLYYQLICLWEDQW